MQATRLHPDGIKPTPLALTLISGWEFTALTTGLVPTITSMVVRLPRPIRALLVAGVAWWLADHFEVV